MWRTEEERRSEKRERFNSNVSRSGRKRSRGCSTVIRGSLIYFFHDFYNLFRTHKNSLEPLVTAE